jgi:hypothetical protein
MVNIVQDHFGNFRDTDLDHYGSELYYSPDGELVSVPLYKLAGDPFTQATLDTTLWTVNLGTGGSVDTSDGALRLFTGTTAANATSCTSVRTARFFGLEANRGHLLVQVPDGGAVNNIRSWGPYSATDGALFMLNALSFNCVTRKGSVDTTVQSGSFNGQYGATWAPGTICHSYEIIYSPTEVTFIVDNTILHTADYSAATWANTIHLPITLENANFHAQSTNFILHCRAATIARFGIPQTQKLSAFQAGLTAGVTLKIGPGNLRGLVFGAIASTSVVTLYDNTAASGKVIFSTGALPASTMPNSVDFGDIPFNIGLTLVVATAASNVLVIYD